MEKTDALKEPRHGSYNVNEPELINKDHVEDEQQIQNNNDR